MKQPKPVNFIANIDIILSAFSLIATLMSVNSSLTAESSKFVIVSHETSTIINAIFSICLIYFALFMLKGIEKARKGLLITHLLQIAVSFIIMKNKLMVIPSIPLFMVYYYFLNRADVLLYFNPDSYDEKSSTEIINRFTIPIKKRLKIGPLRQLIAIFGFIFSSFFLILAQFSLSFNSEPDTIGTIFLFTAIGGVGLHISLTMWANDYLKLLGTILIISASITLMACLTMFSMKDSPQDFQMPANATKAFEQFDPLLSIVAASLVFIAGFYILNYQRNLDIKQKQVEVNKSEKD